MNLHIASGISVIGLLLFRLGWALWGSRLRSYRQYRTSATAVWQHLRGRPRRNFAHSAPAAAMALAMFGVVLVQAVSGLFSSDDILTDGPYARLLSSRGVDFATAIHTRTVLDRARVGRRARRRDRLVCHAKRPDRVIDAARPSTG